MISKGGFPMNVRKATLAGTWYPASASACQREIETYLDEMPLQRDPGRQFWGGIVPHAGWYFSGSIACNVIGALKDEPPPDALVVFGMHLHPHSPNYIMTDGAWETPFGEIEIESALARELAGRFAFTVETDRNYSQDNTIEVQLPFIKYFFKTAKLVPIGVPPAAKSLEIGKAVVEIARDLGLNIKIIGSTDLTHYGRNYGFSPKGVGVNALDWVTRENDAGIISAMTAMNPGEVIRQARENQNACCSGAAAAAIAAVKQLGAGKAEIIQYATSYDKSPGESFVGYVGMVFER
jgi:MEMO1 family protein